MEYMIKKIEQIKDILKGNFTDKADREYWEDELAELERKAANVKENEKYFRINALYDR